MEDAHNTQGDNFAVMGPGKGRGEGYLSGSTFGTERPCRRGAGRREQAQQQISTAGVSLTLPQQWKDSGDAGFWDAEWAPGGDL